MKIWGASDGHVQIIRTFEKSGYLKDPGKERKKKKIKSMGTVALGYKKIQSVGTVALGYKY